MARDVKLEWLMFIKSQEVCCYIYFGRSLDCGRPDGCARLSARHLPCPQPAFEILHLLDTYQSMSGEIKPCDLQPL